MSCCHLVEQRHELLHLPVGYVFPALDLPQDELGQPVDLVHQYPLFAPVGGLFQRPQNHVEDVLDEL